MPSITVCGHQMDVTDSMREYVEKRFNSLAKFTHHPFNIKVTFEKEGGGFAVTGQFHEGQIHIVSHAIGKDVYACVDELKDKIKRELVEAHHR